MAAWTVEDCDHGFDSEVCREGYGAIAHCDSQHEAKEIAYALNAHEPGGAVALAIAALESFLVDTHKAFYGDFRAALAALTGEGQA